LGRTPCYMDHMNEINNQSINQLHNEDIMFSTYLFKCGTIVSHLKEVQRRHY
jgi:hypothetical protein